MKTHPPSPQGKKNLSCGAVPGSRGGPEPQRKRVDMAAFGTLTLLIALVVATYAGTASLVGVRRGSRRLVESGRSGVYALAAVLGLSSVAMWYSFLTHDYSIKYVHRYSDASSPLFYQITAYWGGLDGSILWWVFLLSVFSAIAIYTNRHRHRELLPYAVTTLMAIADFFLYVIIFHKNPFSTYMGDIPTTGQGAEPAACRTRTW